MLKFLTVLMAGGLYPVVHFSSVEGGAPSAVHLLITPQKNCPMLSRSPRTDIHSHTLWSIFWRPIYNR